jgi:O-antigen/teichoic acid export membrane protein
MTQERKRTIIGILAFLAIVWPIFNAMLCVGIGLLEERLVFGTATLSWYNMPKIGYAFWAIQSASVLNAGLLYYLWRRTAQSPIEQASLERLADRS